MQVPGGKVGIDKCGIEAAAAKPPRSSSRDLNLMTAWSFSEIATVPATMPTRLPRKSASDRGRPRSRRNHQPELGGCIGHAPGHIARRSGILRLPDHDVTATRRQTVPSALRTRAPVKFNRSPENLRQFAARRRRDRPACRRPSCPSAASIGYRTDRQRALTRFRMCRSSVAVAWTSRARRCQIKYTCETTKPIIPPDSRFRSFQELSSGLSLLFPFRKGKDKEGISPSSVAQPGCTVADKPGRPASPAYTYGDVLPAVQAVRDRARSGVPSRTGRSRGPCRSGLHMP